MTAPDVAATFRPRSGTELIDAGFVLARPYYPRLMALAAVALAPAILINFGLAVYGGANAQARHWAWVLVIATAANAIAEAALVAALDDAYHGRVVDVAAALRRALARIGTVVSTGIATSVIIMFGLFLLLIPGIIWFTGLFAVPAVVVLEGKGFSASLMRSSDLARGNRRRILLSLGLTLLVIIALQSALQLLFGGFMGTRNPVLTTLVTNAFAIVAAPISAAVLTMAYYDARIRGEGYDIEVMAGQLRASSGAAAATRDIGGLEPRPGA
ncbi:MAG TPA: hypothetical protein VMM18_01840 [Gemmatimonadaceae bacterium]|nr:hypothetical protein [Gemmatimonadaceae bacterium]